MSSLQNKECAACFNQSAAPAQKPSIPVHEMCSCYRPKTPALA
jgi:hypothetical protein